MSDNSDIEKGQPGFGQAALFGLCPRCGARSLYDGVLKFAKICPQCSLDFTRFNVGDGPAAFVTLIVGAIMVGLALWLDVSVSPPFWVHALIWIPVTAGAVVYGLRLGKGALLISEYANNAAEAGADDLEDKAE